MHPTEQLSYIIPALKQVVATIEPGQLESPTPCKEFTVRGVMNHMMGFGGSLVYMYRGETPPDPEVPDTGDRVPAAEFDKVMDELLDAVHSPGAMERTISSPMGEMDGETFARLLAFDGTVHGWDLAFSTGNRFEVPDELVAEVEAFAREAITEDMRDGDTFAAETVPPPYATPLLRLAAFSGRDV